MADDAVFLVKALLAGGVAGMAGKSFVAPLDRVKILVQTQNSDYRHRGIISSLGSSLFNSSRRTPADQTSRDTL